MVLQRLEHRDHSVHRAVGLAVQLLDQSVAHGGRDGSRCRTGLFGHVRGALCELSRLPAVRRRRLSAMRGPQNSGTPNTRPFVRWVVAWGEAHFDWADNLAFFGGSSLAAAGPPTRRFRDLSCGAAGFSSEEDCLSAAGLKVSFHGLGVARIMFMHFSKVTPTSEELPPPPPTSSDRVVTVRCYWKPLLHPGPVGSHLWNFMSLIPIEMPAFAAIPPAEILTTTMLLSSSIVSGPAA